MVAADDAAPPRGAYGGSGGSGNGGGGGEGSGDHGEGGGGGGESPSDEPPEGDGGGDIGCGGSGGGGSGGGGEGSGGVGEGCARIHLHAENNCVKDNEATCGTAHNARVEIWCDGSGRTGGGGEGSGESSAIACATMQSSSHLQDRRMGNFRLATCQTCVWQEVGKQIMKQRILDVTCGTPSRRGEARRRRA